MKTTRTFGALVAFASSNAIALAMFACSDDTTTVTPTFNAPDSGDDDAATTEDKDGAGSATDSGSSKDTSTGAADAKADTTLIPANAITITDGANRFPARSFADYTCPDVAGLGRVVEWPIPQDIATATGLPAGAHVFQIQSASDKNVVIVGPPAKKKYFVGDQAVNVATTGTLFLTTMTAASPATGTIKVEGKWVCP